MVGAALEGPTEVAGVGSAGIRGSLGLVHTACQADGK